MGVEKVSEDVVARIFRKLNQDASKQKQAILILDSFTALSRVCALASILHEYNYAYRIVLASSATQLKNLVHEYESVIGHSLKLQVVTYPKIVGLMLRGGARALRIINLDVFVSLFETQLLGLMAGGQLDQASLVFGVSTTKRTFRDFIYKKAQKLNVSVINYVGRIIDSDDHHDYMEISARWYGQHPNQTKIGERILAKLFGFARSWRRKYQDEEYWILQFRDLLFAKLLFRKETDIDWPHTIYADENYFHPAIEFHLGGRILPNKGLIKYSLSPEELFFDYKKQLGPALSALQRELNQVRETVLLGIADLHQEGYVDQSEDEVNMQLGLIDYWLEREPEASIILCKHPRVTLKKLQHDYGMKNRRVFISVLSGTFLVRYCNRLSVISGSELALYFDYYHKESYLLNPTQQALANDWYGLWEKKGYQRIKMVDAILPFIPDHKVVPNEQA